MPRPIILGVVGDSAAGKTTITRGLVRLLGEDQVTHVATDDYHKYDRTQRAEREITPLNPECNYIDIMTQHLRHLRDGDPILKPVYVHSDGTFGAPVYVQPQAFTIIEGLLAYSTDDLLASFDVRVYLAPPEELRRRWKVQRDTSRRGYTTDQVLAELDKREPDSAQFIRPQEPSADMVIAFQPPEDEDGDAHVLDAQVILRDSLGHPDLTAFTDADLGFTVEEREGERLVSVPGDLDRDRAVEVEEAIWAKLHFASHMRSERLGEYTIGTDLHRSESLALVQLLILYHVVTARAAIALGSDDARETSDRPASEPRESEEDNGDAGGDEADEAAAKIQAEGD